MTDERKQALWQRLQNKIEEWGGNACGVADLQPWQEAMREEYGDVWRPYPRAVSIVIFFPKDIIEQLLIAPTHTYQAYYDIVNARLNDIALRLTALLEKEGYRAFPIPASQRTGDAKQAAIFSHRTAAHLAGLGWVGRNLSLVRQDVGPRLRLVTVLTNAPLPCGAQVQPNRCPPNCNACKEACPAEAILGVAFQPEQPIEERFSAAACAGYLRQVRQSFGKEICGRCVAACPWGKPQ